MMQEPLSSNEKAILKAMASNPSKSWVDEEFVEATGLSMDGVRRGIYFLSEKGLLTFTSDKSMRVELISPDVHLEEEKLVNYSGKAMKDIPADLRSFVGKLKEAGLAKVEKGVFTLEAEPTTSNYKLLAAIERVREGKALSEEERHALEKRGLAKVSSKLKLSATLTEKGKQVAEELSKGASSEGLGKLTRELIESGAWKKARFQPYLVKAEDIPAESSGLEHPLARAIEKIRQIFLSMGFREMAGSYVEESFWVFDALFQPQDHPSRELADTFFLPFSYEGTFPKELEEKIKAVHEKGWHYVWSEKEARKMVLRTHTTVLSARTLYKYKRGKFFSVGRVFRNEATDYKHLAEFYQVEGIIADKRVNFANLLGMLKVFYKRMGFEKIRFRPSFFPYTEPSLEIEVWYEPKKEWVELGGAGIFRPEVVEPLGAEYPVLAWGLSLERPLMMLLGRKDIRDFYTNTYDLLDSVKKW